MAHTARKVKGGFQYGSSGKIFTTKAEAEKRGPAIQASQRGAIKAGKKGK